MVFKYNRVFYKMENGTIYTDYNKAIATGMQYQIEYVPVYEKPNTHEGKSEYERKVKANKRRLA